MLDTNVLLQSVKCENNNPDMLLLLVQGVCEYKRSSMATHSVYASYGGEDAESNPRVNCLPETNIWTIDFLRTRVRGSTARHACNLTEPSDSVSGAMLLSTKSEARSLKVVMSMALVSSLKYTFLPVSCGGVFMPLSKLGRFA